MSNAWFKHFSLKAKMGQNAQGGHQKKVSLGATWMERLCPARSPASSPGLPQRGQWLPQAEAALFGSKLQQLLSPVDNIWALENTLNFQLLQPHCDSVSSWLWPHYEREGFSSGHHFLPGAFPVLGMAVPWKITGRVFIVVSLEVQRRLSNYQISKY